MKNHLSYYLRNILDDTRGSVLFFTLGCLLGVLASSLFFVNDKIERSQKEYDSNRNLVDSCLLNPNVPSHSIYDYDDCYQLIFRK